jgi:hypothetical protein
MNVLERTKRRSRTVGRVGLMSAMLGLALAFAGAGPQPAALLNGMALGALIGARCSPVSRSSA